MQFEHIPGMENLSDLLTKSLPWMVSRTYVEPLLLWKGDTVDDPSGSSNPEGSVAHLAHNATRVSTMDGGQAQDSNEQSSYDVLGQYDSGGDRDGPVFNELWNNQYAVLMDLDTQEE